MKMFRRIPIIASILVVFCYITFTSLALLNYPLPYSPLKNWLSDLGNIKISPLGGQYYNLGIILTASLLFIFYLSIFVWRMKNKKVQNIMVLLSQIFGVGGSIAMIMSAIYPINNPVPHSFWSAALSMGIATSFVFSVAALRYFPQTPKWILVLGILIAALVIVVSIFFNTVQVLEWVVIPLYLLFLLVLGQATRRILPDTLAKPI
jgi:hypothetical membrane protein